MRSTGPFALREPEERELPASLPDTASSRALALALASAANDVKCVDIRVLDVSNVVSWARLFVLATAFSKPQVGAALDRALKAGEALERKPASEPEPSSWVCLDYGDVVCHLFTPAEAEFYDLKGLYSKAEVLKLPFTTAAGAGLAP